MRIVHVVSILCLFLLAACGGGGNPSIPPSTSTGGGAQTVNLVPGTSAQASLSDASSNSTVNFNFPANCVTSPTTVTIDNVTQAGLPHSLKAGKSPKFSLNSNNTYITAFSITTNPSTVTQFLAPASLSGSVATAISSGTTLNVAKWDTTNSVWTDVITLVVGANGAFTQTLTTTSLTGVLTPGIYVVYKPAPGTSTTVSNLGIVLLADDGVGFKDGSYKNGLQVINIYDANGKVLPTPTIKYLPYDGAYDIDGQALTPDGSQGVLVDGGNTVRFFSNVQTGVPLASTNTVDISSYGGDGDSIAILANGDEAVVSGDSSTQLLVISGITSGNPKAAEVISIPGYRDGLVNSKDDAVLLARGGSSVTVYSIAAIAPKTGSLGATISHSLTQLADLSSLPSSSGEDGRNGMAISPADSTRAVVIGNDPTTFSPSIVLLTGLTTTPKASTPVAVKGAATVYSVSITLDGKLAVVGTDSGIVLFTGVDTGTLTQVGTTPYAPTYATGASTTATLGNITTLGITLDGKNVVVGDQTNSSIVVIPINTSKATGFDAPAGILNNVAIPGNDQLVIH